ncbi:MAG: adenylate/guanylate cyclase domain-containing protein, partial [Hydrogenophaga sp.]|nr:adenylate/guanylate cyclase domain-containing protein [Hydrogenophaga sp.]
TPLGRREQLTAEQTGELAPRTLAFNAWQAQDGDACDVHLLNLQRQNAKKVLYRLYAERVASMRRLPPDADWGGTTTFQSK